MLYVWCWNSYPRNGVMWWSHGVDFTQSKQKLSHIISWMIWTLLALPMPNTHNPTKAAGSRGALLITNFLAPPFLIWVSRTPNYFPLSWSVFACTPLVVLQSTFLGAFSDLWFINQNSESLWTVSYVLSRQCLLLRTEVSELSGRNYCQWQLDQPASLSPSDHVRVSGFSMNHVRPPSSCVA
jgi:hypothetical protein